MQYKYLLTQPYFDEQEIEKVKECLNSRWVTQGPMTAEFEKLFLEKHGGQYAVAVSSCTAGLHMAMLALGIEAGDEVLVPAYTWVTSANCIEYTGAKAVFVDVDRNNFNINPAKIEEAIHENTKAIVVVHEFGCAAPMDEIMKIAERYSLRVVEDCACAIGTKYNGKPVGTIGDIGVFSFHPRKVITTGEGGMCVTSKKELAQSLDQLRNHGNIVDAMSSAYGRPYYMGDFDLLGYNFRLSDIQAAVGVAQMDKLDDLLAARKKCAVYYAKLLQNNSQIKLPEQNEKYGPTYQSFVVLLNDVNVKKRNFVMEYLQKREIQTKQGTHAVHRLTYYKNKYGLKEGDYPEAVLCEDTSITLPIFPNMEQTDQDFIVENLSIALELYDDNN